MEIVNEEAATPVEALQVLDNRSELNTAQQETLEYLRKHVRIQDLDAFTELQEELEAVDGLKQKHTTKLLEVMPFYSETVEAIFSKERVQLENSDIDQIISIVDSVEA